MNTAPLATEAVVTVWRRLANMATRLPGAAWSHKWRTMAVVLAVCFSGWAVSRMFAGTAISVDQVTRAELIETVVATGNVQTPFRVIIGSQITGTVEEVRVDEGQRVTQGQNLVSLEPHELMAAVVQAQGAVAQADAHMHQLEELTLPTARDSLTQAEATYLNARQTYDRAAILVRKGDETRVVLEAAQKDLDIARTQVRMAELQVYTASPGGSDYVTGQAQSLSVILCAGHNQRQGGVLCQAKPRSWTAPLRSFPRSRRSWWTSS